MNAVHEAYLSRIRETLPLYVEEKRLEHTLGVYNECVWLAKKFDLSEEDTEAVYNEFVRVAAKKNVGPKELEAIISGSAMQVPSTYTLVSYMVNSSGGNALAASAQIVLDKKGEQLQGISMGDGPIDAAFVALEQIMGCHFELDDFQIQAVTEGKEAMGSALVKLRADGKLYAGRGISTDIIGASIRAYVAAVNKIVFEQTV